MTDIVERLRGTWAWSHGRLVNPDGPEAADEIERLRSTLRGLIDAHDNGFNPMKINGAEWFTARAALEGK